MLAANNNILHRKRNSVPFCPEVGVYRQANVSVAATRYRRGFGRPQGTGGGSKHKPNALYARVNWASRPWRLQDRAHVPGNQHLPGAK